MAASISSQMKTLKLAIPLPGMVSENFGTPFTEIEENPIQPRGLTYNHSVGTVACKWEVYTKYTLHAIPNLGKL